LQKQFFPFQLLITFYIIRGVSFEANLTSL